MIEVDVPGYGRLELAHVVLDFSGTLSEDGVLLPGIRERIERLASRLLVHVLTSDTHGRAREQLDGAPCTLHVLEGANHTGQKMRFVLGLGADQVAAVGNGNNDEGMLRAARVGIAVCGGEGLSTLALGAATILAPSPAAALDLLLNPARLTATLRR